MHRYALLVLCLLAAGCGGGQAGGSDGDEGTPKVYVSIVHHNAEYVDHINDHAYYDSYREGLLALGEYLHGEGLALNLQSDWNFLTAVGLNETPGSQYLANTGGKNIVLYFEEDLGHDVDPHAHETEYNYADVAYLTEQLGVEPSGLAGGFIAIPAEDSVYNEFLSPMRGWKYPDYVWQTGWLWGAASTNHKEDVAATGVWKPKDADNFFVNDDSAPLPHIGGWTLSLEGLYDLLSRVEKGEFRSAGCDMLTAAIYISWEDIADDTEALKSAMPTLRQYEKNGEIVFAPLAEVARTWQDAYGAKGGVCVNSSAD